MLHVGVAVQYSSIPLGECQFSKAIPSPPYLLRHCFCLAPPPPPHTLFTPLPPPTHTNLTPNSHRAAGAWRMCMVLAARLQHTPAQQQELARDLSEQLLASGAGGDAAVLLLQHLGDVDGAVAALITAKEWREGLRVAYAHGRPDLVDTDLVPAAAQVSGGGCTRWLQESATR